METRTNKIVQNMEVGVNKEDAEFGVLMDFLRKFVQDKTHQTIEGKISHMYIRTECGWGEKKDDVEKVEFTIQTIKEDRVKMLTHK